MSVGGWEASPTIGAESAPGTARRPSTERAELDERRLLRALRGGDEAAFVALVSRHHSMLARMAQLYLPDCATDDLVHEVWTDLLHRLDRLDSGVSLRVTLLQILLDRARSRVREGDSLIPFAAYHHPTAVADAPSVDPSSFQASGPWIGHWAVPVADWGQGPAVRRHSRETRDRVAEVRAMLPPAQREVITLRDVEGWSAGEVSDALGITETTQRSLLHRARSRIRASLDAALLER